MAFYLPPGMCGAHARGELFFAEREFLREVSAKQSRVFGPGSGVDCHINRQHGREAENVVPPERSLNLGQIGFAQEAAIAGRLEVHTADLDIKRVLLWRYQQVGAIGPQLAIDLVPD